MADVTTRTVKYGGRYYAPGQEIQIKDAAERKRLIKIGAIAPGEEKAPKRAEEPTAE